MTFSQLVVLLPCHSLEDFSLHRDAGEAEQILSAWSALWHPSLVACAGTMPGWFPTENPPQAFVGHLVIIPPCSRPLLPDGWIDQARHGGACVIEGLDGRDEMLAAALGQLDPDPDVLAPEAIEPELAADFLALGFCHFMVELLTRQLRYMSNLDEESFKSTLVRAAGEAVQGEADAARDELHGAFKLLHESREYFYPVEVRLLDLTLVAATTIGRSLRDELKDVDKVSRNLLISGRVIQQMARQEPDSLAALKDAVQANRAAIVGGEYDQWELPLLSPETIRRNLTRGLAVYEQHLGARPSVYGRRRFGLTPVLPQILQQLGFTAVLHGTLDDGRFPTGNQSRMQWEGIDQTAVDAIGRVPVDVRGADTFLRFSERLGEAMDLDHVATMVLAHWPGRASRWYEDLRRIASYSSVAGTFSTLHEYFEETGLAGQQTQYRADQYRSPYLRQEVAAERPDPISRWVRYFARLANVEAAQTLNTLAACGFAAPNDPNHPTEPLLEQVENTLAEDFQADADLDQRIEEALNESLARFSRSLGGHSGGSQGYLVANPGSAAQRRCLEVPELDSPPETTGAVRAVDAATVLVDVPPMGFAWIGPGVPSDAETKPVRRKKKEEPPLAEENTLRNEFFEVRIDPYTGSVRSISDYRTRGARLAQQIAMRRPTDDPDASYSIMAVDEIEVTSAGPLVGEIVCRGRLVDREARQLARFTQTNRIHRGSRILEISIELSPDVLPDQDPWNSYYAARFAWNDATANLYRSVNLANLPTDAVQLESPQFVDIRSGKIRTTLLTGGLPYHRRHGLRMLDTLLIVHGETARRFRLGIGIDLPHPVPASLDFLGPKPVLATTTSPPAPGGWLFHLDHRNVLATHWEPKYSDGQVEGFRVRLLETDGCTTSLQLRALKPIASAKKLGVDAADVDLTTEGDRITIELGPHEWAEVVAYFAR